MSQNGGSNPHENADAVGNAQVLHLRLRLRSPASEDELGTLAEGYFADIVVIDKDLFAIPETELMDRKVIMTVMDGKIIYEDPGLV